ncbi:MULTISPECIES: nucleotidyltransferase family protein [unclassified Sedimentibacter]|nr:nucleotidyltransferase domain-containing protein [Sedimentibacter sp. MB35-C1]WMJ77140.1 nucleotidyltransferase domain-containing protein [Sedimentibacter sp. MB35-C1]
MNKFTNKPKNFLIEKYQCDTIILYGSYARGDFTKQSDVNRRKNF